MNFGVRIFKMQIAFNQQKKNSKKYRLKRFFVLTIFLHDIPFNRTLLFYKLIPCHTLSERG